MVTVLAIVGAVLGSASLILHAVVPHLAANSFAVRAEEFVDEALGLLGSKVNDGQPASAPVAQATPASK